MGIKGDNRLFEVTSSRDQDSRQSLFGIKPSKFFLSGTKRHMTLKLVKYHLGHGPTKFV